jgi:hypothetical protein
MSLQEPNTLPNKHRVFSSEDNRFRFYDRGEVIPIHPGVILDGFGSDPLPIVRRVLNYAYAIGSYDSEAYEAELKNISDHEDDEFASEYFYSMLDDIVNVLNAHNETEGAEWLVDEDALFYNYEPFKPCLVCGEAGVGEMEEDSRWSFCARATCQDIVRVDYDKR